MISIRPVRTEDAPSIGNVFDAAVREGWPYLGELSRKPMFPPEEWDAEVLKHQEPNLMLVAETAAEGVIGFVAIHPQDSELYLLFVHPQQAGRGVGRALLDAAHTALRAAGCGEVFLYTHEQNARAIAVYEAAGYRCDGFVKETNFRGVALREPRLVKAL
jgi:ribosomal protein S18 acetylase RimI-like enzyme